MSKKGQVTLFIIIGIVILLIIAAVLYLTEERSTIPVNQAELLTITQVSDSVYSNTQECLNHKLKEVIDLVSIQGGYFGAPTEFLRYSVNDVGGVLYVPYYIKDNENLGITKEKYESSISYGLEKKVKDCLDFSRYPYNITSNPAKASVETIIEERYVKSTVKVPIWVEVGDSVEQISSFTVMVKSKAKEMYDLANNITTQQQELGDVVCFSCLPEIMSDYSINVSTIQTEDKDNYIILYDLEDLEQGNGFIFAHSLPKQKSNVSPSLEEIPSLNARVGEVFIYTLSVPAGFKSYDDTDLFDIDEGGKIMFTPSEDDRGDHLITLWLNNSDGNHIENTLTLSIT